MHFNRCWQLTIEISPTVVCVRHHVCNIRDDSVKVRGSTAVVTDYLHSLAHMKEFGIYLKTGSAAYKQ